MNKVPEIGDAVTFVPYAFVDHHDPRPSDRINARIIYVNRKHRYYTAEGPCNGGRIREAFRF